MPNHQDPIELTESRYINKQAVNRGLVFWSIGIGLFFACTVVTVLTVSVRNVLSDPGAEEAESILSQILAPTLMPTADLALVASEDDDISPSLSLIVTPIPVVTLPATPTVVPADAVLLSPTLQIRSPAPTELLTMNESVLIEADVYHPEGVTNIQLLLNGQTVASLAYVGQKEIQFEQQWVPLADGRQTLQIVLIDGLGERLQSERVEIRVIDEAFATRSQPIFERVNQVVFATRGLRLKEEIYPMVMGDVELKQRLRESGYTVESARQDVLVLQAFRFAEPGYDLFEASIQYAGGGIGGFYSPETKDFVLVSIDQEINALEELVYAHELMHALQDQHFSLGLLANEEDPLGFEADLALRSLAEGEARLIEELYLNSEQFTDDQRIELFNVFQRLYRPRQYTIDPIPVLVSQFEFPYEAGRDFVDFLLAEQGWEGLNQAWENPPTSTEQILHPTRYLAGDQPREVSLEPIDEALGREWTMIREDVFGEFYLRQYLSQALGPEVVDLAATGWGGDRYQVYHLNDSDEVLMMMRVAWDNGEEAGQFATAIDDFAEGVFGSQFVQAYPGAVCRQADQVYCLIQAGGDWLIVQAPTADLARLALDVQFQ